MHEYCVNSSIAELLSDLVRYAKHLISIPIVRDIDYRYALNGSVGIFLQ